MNFYAIFPPAYSLYAWLSSSMTGMWAGGHIRYWDDVMAALKMYLESNGGPVFANGTIEFPPNSPQYLKVLFQMFCVCLQTDFD